MEGFQRRFPPQKAVRKRPTEDGCTIETKKTKTGKKIIIGRGCSKEQIAMFRESGELNLDNADRCD